MAKRREESTELTAAAIVDATASAVEQPALTETEQVSQEIIDILTTDLQDNEEAILKVAQKPYETLSKSEVQHIISEVARRNKTSIHVAGQALAILLSKGAANRGGI